MMNLQLKITRFTSLYICIITHSWITRDSPMFCIRHYGGKYDCIRYVFVFNNMTCVGFLEFDSIFNKADNPSLCYLIVNILLCLICITEGILCFYM